MHARRVYSSSDGEFDVRSVNDDDDDIDQDEDDNRKFVTRSNAFGPTQQSSRNSASDKRPNGRKSTKDTGTVPSVDEFIQSVDQEWDNDIDDQLSLEELQLNADAITAAIEKAPVGLEATLGKNASPKRRPRTSSHSSSSRASSSSQSGQDRRKRRQRRVKFPPESECKPSDGATLVPCQDNTRRLYLLDRVKQAANELAKLQVMTASRAADAACDHHRAAEESRDTQRLRVELRTLLITLDHLTRLTLEQAFITRDALETHR